MSKGLYPWGSQAPSMKRGHKIFFCTLLQHVIIGSVWGVGTFFMVSFKMRGHFKLISHQDPCPKMGGFFWFLVAHTLALLGYSRKKFRRAVETYFFQKIPGIFRFATLSLEILEKTKLLRRFHKIVLQPLGIPRPKTKTHGYFTWFFFD